MSDDKIYGYAVPETSSRLIISEEQLLKSKKIEDESRHFHSFDKGCEVEEQTRMKKGNYKHSYKVLFCKTHECDCHLDGWMIGAFGGTISKKLSNIPRCQT